MLLILTPYFLSERKYEIHLRRDGFTCMALSFWSSICDGIVLKALANSNNRVWAVMQD